MLHTPAFDPEKGHISVDTHASESITRPVSVYSGDEVFSNESFISSTSTLTADQPKVLEYSLPEKRHNRALRNIRYSLFSVYVRLNLLIIIANVAVIVALAIKGELFESSTKKLGTAAASNLLVAILIRQELIVNLIFIIFGKLPKWLPLRIRCVAAKVYHLGGLHSGAAVAGSIWFAFLNVPVIKAFAHDDEFQNSRTDITVLSITIALDVLLVGIIAFSHPWLRSKFHNTWEAVHRFAGWSTVALFWAHVILTTDAEHKMTSRARPFAQLLAANPIFWCLFAATVAMILPWLRLRKVPVRAEYLSERAVRLHFGYANLPLCASPRFSDSPLREWHAFAGIPEKDGIGFSVLVSRAGDWTEKIIRSPPKELWVKGIPTRGVLHLAPIFKKVVLVATGSGIGPILSLLYARDLNVRIIWSTPDPLKYYTTDILEHVRLADPEAVIIETNKHFRPDLLQETYRLYKRSKAEAVFIISNPSVTRKVVYGLESRGVPVFAPIFDS